MAEMRAQEVELAAGRLANEMHNMVTSILHDTKTVRKLYNYCR